MADFAVLSKDFFQVTDEKIKNLYAVMTVVGGNVVHAAEEFSTYNPALPPVSPDWPPVKYYGTYGGGKVIIDQQTYLHHCAWDHIEHSHHRKNHFGCLCWAF